MQFIPFIFDAEQNRVAVTIAPMSSQDAAQTTVPPEWQTAWNSGYLNQPSYQCYAVKNGAELVALGAYEVLDELLVVHIVYMEAQPESNPTMTRDTRKYAGIGRLLIAYGIKLSVDCGFAGDVVLEAKTTELAQHYIRDFGAVMLPQFRSAAPRLMIADDAAKEIFCSYLE